jgi:hypothetical protein
MTLIKIIRNPYSFLEMKVGEKGWTNADSMLYCQRTGTYYMSKIYSKIYDMKGFKDIYTFYQKYNVYIYCISEGNYILDYDDILKVKELCIGSGEPFIDPNENYFADLYKVEAKMFKYNPLMRITRSRSKHKMTYNDKMIIKENNIRIKMERSKKKTKKQEFIIDDYFNDD